MLCNLANLLGIEADDNLEISYVDEDYFASWAKKAIYKVSSMWNFSGSTRVMTGTGNDKFSPWMNYTREQAIATMVRLYGCKTADSNKTTAV